jgi:hypothetical protein
VTLRRATLLALLGLSYTFTLRAIGTFLPQMFTVALAAQVVTITSLIASLTSVIFYVVFRRDYVQKDEIALKRVSALSIIGSSAILALRAKNLPLVFDASVIALYEASPFLFRVVRSHALEALTVWICSIFFLSFFVALHREVLHRKLMSLRRATLSGVIGSSLGTLTLTVTLLNYAYSGRLRWSHVMFRTSVFLFLPFISLSFALLFYFFVIFYKHQTLGSGLDIKT